VITYANHLYDVSCALQLDYGKVTEAFTAKEDWKGLRRYTQVYHNGKRGFGGPCFPKDINSFLVFCTSLGVKAEVIQAAVNANKRLLRFQNLTEQTAERY
jgi:UDP-glucose 6-dehydrogenase